MNAQDQLGSLLYMFMLVVLVIATSINTSITASIAAATSSSTTNQNDFDTMTTTTTTSFFCCQPCDFFITNSSTFAAIRMFRWMVRGMGPHARNIPIQRWTVDGGNLAQRRIRMNTPVPGV